MDLIQTKLIQMMQDAPGCIDSRQKLRSVLADYIPTEKLRINLILNAYDEEIVDKLKLSTDRTLIALNIAKQLTENYGITNEAAIWSVSSWCYMLSYVQIGDALGSFEVNSGESHDLHKTDSGQNIESVVLGMGTYKAGIDLPYGELSLSVNEKTELGINYGIDDSPNDIDTTNDFMSKTYIKIKKGQYLKLYSYETGGDYLVTITKVD